jgi:hypothetical protein
MEKLLFLTGSYLIPGNSVTDDKKTIYYHRKAKDIFHSIKIEPMIPKCRKNRLFFIGEERGEKQVIIEGVAYLVP